MVNLFGALDTTEIPEFPDNGTFTYILKTVKTVKTKDGDDKLVMEFHLDDEDSPFNNDKFAKWFNIYPDIEDSSELTPDIIKDLNKLKKWLLALSVPESELTTVEFADLTGTRVQGYGFRRNKYNGEGEEYFLANIKPE